MNRLPHPTSPIKETSRTFSTRKKVRAMKKNLNAEGSGILHHPRVFKGLILDGTHTISAIYV
jgi:hypothetical protein